MFRVYLGLVYEASSWAMAMPVPLGRISQQFPLYFFNTFPW